MERRLVSRAEAMVDLPEAERPVSQIVRPFWWRRRERWGWVREGDQVRLLFVVVVVGGFEEGGGLGTEVGSGAVEVDILGCGSGVKGRVGGGVVM